MKSKPRISVVVVSDFEATNKKSWKDELVMAKALAQQDIKESFEVIMVESESHINEPVPPKLKELLPGIKLVFHNAEQSATLKDYGSSQATGEWIAVLEADCVPEVNWLRLVVEAADNNPDMDVISGRTHYGNTTSYKRVLTLLDRSFNDSGVSKEASFISNNGALFKKEVIEKFPYPEAITPFLSARLRNIKIRNHGYRFFYERNALMRHAIGGLDFIKDQHTNYAHMEMKISQKQTLSYIPILLGKMFWLDLKRYFWLRKLYLRWYDWPLAILLLFAVRIPESVGMYYAVKNVGEIPDSSYR